MEHLQPKPATEVELTEVKSLKLCPTSQQRKRTGLLRKKKLEERKQERVYSGEERNLEHQALENQSLTN